MNPKRALDLLHNRRRDGTLRAFPASRFLTIVIGVSSLLTAGIGYLFNNANAQSSQAGSVAQLLTAQAGDSLRQGYEQAESDYFGYLNQVIQHEAAVTSFWNATIDPTDATQWQDEATTWSDIAAAQAKSVPSDLVPGAITGRLRDPMFPVGFFAERTRPGTLLQAQADGQNDVSSGWSRQAGSYGVALALIAIALFLLGNALNLAGRNRLVFSVVGMAMVLGSCVWVALITPAGPQPSSDAAANAYTTALIGMDTARAPGDFQPAVDELTIAINDRPNYARAYEMRAVAEISRGSVAIEGGYTTLVQPQWLDRAGSDAQRAYDLGINDEQELLDLAFVHYEQWLHNGAGLVSSQAVQLANQLTQLDPTYSIAWFDRATYELASGDSGDVKQSYQMFLQTLLHTPDGKKRSPSAAQPDVAQQAEVATSLSVLDNLATAPALPAHPDLRDTISKELALLTSSIATGEVSTPSSDPGIANLSVPAAKVEVGRDADHLFASFPAPPGWGATSGEPLLTSQPVTVAWYQRSATSGWPASAWSAVPEAVAWGAGNPYALYYDAQSHAYDAGAFFNDLATGHCLAPGQYRVDVFVAGHRIVSATTAGVEGAELVPQHRGDIAFGVCVPPAWQPQAPSTATIDPVELQAANDESTGAAMWRVDEPSDVLHESAAQVQASIEAAIAAVLRDPGDHGLPVASFNTLQLSSATPGGYFASLSDAVLVSYVGSDFELQAGGGLSQDGGIYLGFVFGKPADFMGTDPLLVQVYSSFGPSS